MLQEVTFDLVLVSAVRLLSETSRCRETTRSAADMKTYLIHCDAISSELIGF